ncbi:MAG TPA: protein-glutamate O-methyltransferase CheR [Kofleriaceae bacterium]
MLAHARPLDAFTALVAARLGLRLDPRTAGEIIERRAGARQLTVGRYLGAADEPGELRELASELTVNETYFFRHAEQLDAFVAHALPDRLAARAGDRQLRVLSAGCSTGEEPYTLAMLLHDRMPAGWQVEVRGVDIDRRALDHAAAGRYSRWSLRAVPEAVERRWFAPARDAAVLSPALRGAVSLAEVNLATDATPWQPGWDVVFCRNVLMYFTGDQADALIARIVDGLLPGGYLFLGHAEILGSRGASRPGARGAAALETCSSHGTFYYRRAAAPAHAAGRIAATQPIRTEREPGPLDAALDALVSTGGDEPDIQLQRALIQLAQIGAGT